MKVRQVADGLLEDVKAMPSIDKLRSNIAREKAYVTSKAGPITRTMRDVARTGATYKMRMNQFVASNIGLGLDGQTKAYIKPDAKEAKAIFSSKYVPFTDGTELLTGTNKKTMSQYGYGNVVCSSLPSAPKVKRIGFNNTLVDESNGKITEYLAGVPTYRNFAVHTDFPKGAGGVSANKMWVDGTYEETMAAIHKKQDERTKDLDLKAPIDIRKQIFQQQALAGNQVYGNELLKQNIEDEFAQERTAQLQSALAARPGMTPERIAQLGIEVQIARRAGQIERQLRLPSGSVVAREAARGEIAAEAERKATTEQIRFTADQEAAQRRALNEERQAARVARRARITTALSTLPQFATFAALGQTLQRGRQMARGVAAAQEAARVAERKRQVREAAVATAPYGPATAAASYEPVITESERRAESLRQLFAGARRSGEAVGLREVPTPFLSSRSSARRRSNLPAHLTEGQTTLSSYVRPSSAAIVERARSAGIIPEGITTKSINELAKVARQQYEKLEQFARHHKA